MQLNAPVTVQVPTSLRVISDPVVPLTNFANCALADYGIALAITYQVQDQNGNPIRSTTMEPVEQILNLVVDGIPEGDPQPSFVDIGPSQYPGTSKYTNVSGQFLDAPWGLCATSPITEVLTQVIGIVENNLVYVVRTSGWTTQSTSPGHGSTTNGTDISASH